MIGKIIHYNNWKKIKTLFMIIRTYFEKCTVKTRTHYSR